MIQVLKSFSDTPKWLLPLVLGAGAFGIGAFVEKVSSLEFREDCRQFLTQREYEPYLGILPDLVARSFNRTFGERQKSLKCFVRSVEFSTAFLLVTTIITELFNPAALHVVIAFLYAQSWKAIPLLGLGWVSMYIIPSWLMIAKTRFVIWVLQRAQVTPSILLLIVLIDLMIGSWTFLTVACSGIALIAMEEAARTGKLPADSTVFAMLMGSGFLSAFMIVMFAAWLIPTGKLYWSVPIGNLFWASMAPSVWLWLYVMAALATRLLVRSAPTLQVVSYVLDVEHHAVRSMGVVAALLVAVASAVCVAVGSIIF